MRSKSVVLSEWITDNLKRTGLKQKELADIIGISEAAVSQYKKGRVLFCDDDILEKLAAAFGTEVPVIRRPDDDDDRNSGAHLEIMPVGNLVSIPIFDCASAGPGAYADECAVGYRLAEVPNPLEKDNYFFVNVSGDSMYPLIPDKSMVLVHRQDFIENNKVAIVLVDGEEALVKRVRYGNNIVELISENKSYAPRVFKNDNISSIRILGQVVECVTEIN